MCCVWVFQKPVSEPAMSNFSSFENSKLHGSMSSLSFWSFKKDNYPLVMCRGTHHDYKAPQLCTFHS
jgi:hypothetical protein